MENTAFVFAMWAMFQVVAIYDGNVKWTCGLLLVGLFISPMIALLVAAVAILFIPAMNA